MCEVAPDSFGAVADLLEVLTDLSFVQMILALLALTRNHGYFSLQWAEGTYIH